MFGDSSIWNADGNTSLSRRRTLLKDNYQKNNGQKGIFKSYKRSFEGNVAKNGEQKIWYIVSVWASCSEKWNGLQKQSIKWRVR